MQQEDEELISCLSKEEREKIVGKSILQKMFKKIKMKREKRAIEKYEEFVDRIERENVDDIIPEEYKKGE